MMTGRLVSTGLPALLLLLVACSGVDTARREAAAHPARGAGLAGQRAQPEVTPRRAVTLAFAGDVHFELHLAALLDRPSRTLGPIRRTLADADLTMVNLETAITERGTPEAKELELAAERFHFRTSPAALDVLAAAGVDVLTMANNHGADYGQVGLRDTLRAIRNGPVHVVGIGRSRKKALAPYRVSIRGTDIAFLAADSSFREGASTVWAAGPRTAGVAAARASRPRALLAAVRDATVDVDVVVVYLHWGEELQDCPTPQQLTTARALAAAGADIIVGTHAHVQLGSGWLGDTYVNFGLGNFLWYHDHQPESGVLTVRVENGEVVGDSWIPARIGTEGRPTPLLGDEASTAIGRWRALRACSGLAGRRDALPAYSSTVDGFARPSSPAAGVRVPLVR
jgi:hypothetical protein